MWKYEDLKDYETIKKEMLKDIKEKTKSFSLVDFFNGEKERKVAIVFTEKQVICGFTPFWCNDVYYGRKEWGHSESILILIEEAKINPYMAIDLGNSVVIGKYGYTLICNRSYINETHRNIINKIRDIVMEMNDDSLSTIDWDTYYDDMGVGPLDRPEEKFIGIPIVEFEKMLGRDRIKIAELKNSRAKKESVRYNNNSTYGPEEPS